MNGDQSESGENFSTEIAAVIITYGVLFFIGFSGNISTFTYIIVSNRSFKEFLNSMGELITLYDTWLFASICY